MSLCVFAFGCHPDDIEFMMGGTLFLLKKAGAEIHYMNPANGCLGTNQYPRKEIIEIRRNEGMKAAEFLGAQFHESIANDLEVFYSTEMLKLATAKVREIQPDIMLLTSLEDYMEDHMNAARIGYTAAFCRGMVNFETNPDRDPILKDVRVYHAMPYGLHDGMNRLITSDFYVNIESVMGKKREMLAIHESQKKWLDESQGLDAYLDTMSDMCAEMGRMSLEYEYAEGWRRHSHLGFCTEFYDPFSEVLDTVESIS